MSDLTLKEFKGLFETNNSVPRTNLEVQRQAISTNKDLVGTATAVHTS